MAVKTARKAPDKPVITWDGKLADGSTSPKSSDKKHPLKTANRWNKSAVITYICAQLASSTLSLYKILSAGYSGLPLPDYSTIAEWLREDDNLAQQYARAKEDQADYLAEELVEIADNATGDYNRDRLRLDARKWVAAKLKPKKYGDKLDLNHGGTVNLNFAADDAECL